MSKKLVITLSVVFGAILIVLILFWTLFALSSVTVEYSSSKINITATDEEIVEAGEFRMGACVLFESKKKSIENIENKAKENKNFAYIRVLNIETVFPNKIVIHVAEREELFSVKFQSFDENGQATDKFYVCDRDLRVLNILDSVTGNLIVLDGLSISNDGVQIGDFLQVEERGVLNFYAAMLQNNISLSQQLGKFESATLLKIKDELGVEYPAMQLVSRNGRKFLIENIDFALPQKIQLMFSAESAFFGYEKVDSQGNLLDENGQKIMLSRGDEGKYVKSETGDVALSYSLLARCQIVVGNLVLGENLDRTEKDIYYALQEI